MPTIQFVRVRLKATGAHITISRTSFDPHLHVEMKAEPLDRNGQPRPAKYPPRSRPSTTASQGTALGEAAPTATTTPEATKEAKP